MSSTQALKRLAKAWPVDPARPNLQFGELLKHIADTTPADRISARTIGAVKALEDGLMAKKYPISSKMTQPASFPEHYRRMTLVYENALQGKKRSWYQILFGIYK